jgi:cytochrome c biogenesis protein CcdA
MSFDLPVLAFAFSAGIFALISPCGYVLLPGYISYYLGSKPLFGRRFFSGLLSGFASTAGIITVFSIIGMLASFPSVILPQIVPALELVAGAIIIVMGIIILLEIRLPSLGIRLNIEKRKGLIGSYIFGVTYGLATVGCSASLFLLVLSFAMGKGTLISILTFSVYSLGMGFPLIITFILIAQARETIVKRIIRATPFLHKISGILLIIVGVYLIYFYYSNLILITG